MSEYGFDLGGFDLGSYALPEYDLGYDFNFDLPELNFPDFDASLSLPDFNFDFSLPEFPAFNLDSFQAPDLPSMDPTFAMPDLDLSNALAAPDFQMPDFSSAAFSTPGPTGDFGAFRGLDRDLGQLSEGWYQGALGANNGDYGLAGLQLGALRENPTVPSMNQDPALRNAQHALASMELMQRGTPAVGLPWAAGAVPAYSLAKMLVQGGAAAPPDMNLDPMGGLSGRDLNALMQWINNVGTRWGGDSGNLLKATPPSLSEIWWGMRPLWSRR